MININLKQLEAFAAVVEQGSFTKAAAHLYLAQSTVSNHIQSLEEELHVVLFRRETKKHVQLTSDGQRVYQHAKEILSQCRALEEDIRGDGDRELVIGASTMPSQLIIPQLISGFVQVCPDCTCVVKNGDSEQVHQMLLDGVIQIAFAGAAYNRQALVYERLTEDHLVVITPNNPRFAALQADGVYGRELLTEPIILREQGSGTQKLADTYLSSIDFCAKKLHVVARVSSPDVLRDMVIKGAGVSILSASSVIAQVASGELLQFELDERPVSRQIYMIRRKKAPLSEYAKKFIAYTKECMNVE